MEYRNSVPSSSSWLPGMRILFQDSKTNLQKIEDENKRLYTYVGNCLVGTSLIEPLLAVEHSISAGLVHTPLRMYTQKALSLLRQKIQKRL